MSLTNELNCRISVFKPEFVKTDLGDTKQTYKLYRKLWASIKTTGGSNTTNVADINEAKLNHSIIIRANALKDITKAMFIVYQKHRYNIDYWRPHYLHPDRLEIICTMDTTPIDVKAYG